MMIRHFVSSNRMIFDLGMNNGDDTEYYLHKGYRVVAVEANPTLCESAARRFSQDVERGNLVIHNAAIWESYDRKVFYVNEENDHWSSLDIQWAGRNDSRYVEVPISCVPLAHLLALHGVPSFIKIDIEGVDHMVLDQLKEAAYLPYYLSMEDCRFGYEYLEAMRDLGYCAFKLMNQADVGQMVDAETGFRFKQGSSGPLGEAVPGPWLDYEQMIETYSRVVRDRNNNRHAPRTIWWDIHCRGPEAHAV